jgi:hypothetical protein
MMTVNTVSKTRLWRELVEAAPEVNLFVRSWKSKQDKPFADLYQFRSIATGDDVSGVIKGAYAARCWLDGYKTGLSQARTIALREQGGCKTAADGVDFRRYEYRLRPTSAKPQYTFEAYRWGGPPACVGDCPYILVQTQADSCVSTGNVWRNVWKYRHQSDLVAAMSNVARLERWDGFPKQARSVDGLHSV